MRLAIRCFTVPAINYSLWPNKVTHWSKEEPNVASKQSIKKKDKNKKRKKRKRKWDMLFHSISWYQQLHSWHLNVYIYFTVLHCTIKDGMTVLLICCLLGSFIKMPLILCLNCWSHLNSASQVCLLVHSLTVSLLTFLALLCSPVLAFSYSVPLFSIMSLLSFSPCFSFSSSVPSFYVISFLCFWLCYSFSLSELSGNVSTDEYCSQDSTKFNFTKTWSAFSCHRFMVGDLCENVKMQFPKTFIMAVSKQNTKPTYFRRWKNSVNFCEIPLADANVAVQESGFHYVTEHKIICEFLVHTG